MLRFNPNDLKHPGNGYRFLFAHEITDLDIRYRGVEWWDRDAARWSVGGSYYPSGTLRTKLSVDELAKINAPRTRR